MNEHEKNAALVLEHQNGEESMIERSDLLSKNQNTTEGGRRQGLIEGLLLHGENNAIPSAKLAEMAGLPDTRTLQKQIERERLEGAMILAGPHGGYFLPSYGPEGREQIRRHYFTLRKRCLSSLRTLKHARRALQMLDGQLDLLDSEEMF